MADPVTSLICAVGATGRPGREVAVRLDLLRSTGAGYVFRRLTHEARLLKRHGGEWRRPAYRAIWCDAARAVGAEVVDLPGGFLEIRLGRTSTIVWNNMVELDDALVLKLALEKTLVHRLLIEARLPVPEHLEFDSSDLNLATSFLERGPCVVKPVSSAGGGGVTTGIRSLPDLMRATLRAARIDRRLLIERQASGEFYRFLFLDGQLLDVIRRLPPRVTGDGISTIEKLIALENRRRVARSEHTVLFPLHVDLDSIFTLRRNGLSLKTVPSLNARVPVKTVVNQNGPEDNETVREHIAEELVSEAAAAAQVIGLRVAGVDIITHNLRLPLRASGGVIIEVNGTPGLHYHYEVADRANASRVAVPILQKLLS
jgi:D-alanine-D-alanine ligase-like ATP-grasp enzyme